MPALTSGKRWYLFTGNIEADILKATDVPVVERYWRDQTQALITVCCQLGCRRSELSTLC